MGRRSTGEAPKAKRSQTKNAKPKNSGPSIDEQVWDKVWNCKPKEKEDDTADIDDTDDKEENFHTPGTTRIDLVKIRLDKPQICVAKDQYVPAWRVMRKLYADIGKATTITHSLVLARIADLQRQGRRRFMTKEERDAHRATIEDFKSKKVNQALKKQDPPAYRVKLVDHYTKMLPPDCLPTTGWLSQSIMQDDVRQAMRTPIPKYDKGKRTGDRQLVPSSYARAVEKRLTEAEFSPSKLYDILQGTTQIARLPHVGIALQPQHWYVTLEEFTHVLKKGKNKGKTRTYTRPVVHIPSLYPNEGHVQFLGQPLIGRRAQQDLQKLEQLVRMQRHVKVTNEEIEKDATLADLNNWKRGTFFLRPKRQRGKIVYWSIDIPFHRPVEYKDRDDVVLVIHRGIANAVTAGVFNLSTGETKFHSYSGANMVNLKMHFYRRRRALGKELAQKRVGKGRGKAKRFVALRKLKDKERLAVKNEINHLARWVQDLAERTNTRLTIIDDFSDMQSDVRSEDTRYAYLPPYIRSFPMAAIRDQIIRVLLDRVSIPVEVIKAFYISERCPACASTGTEEKKNIRRAPKVQHAFRHQCSECGHVDLLKGSADEGRFECVACGYTATPDGVAVINLFYEATKIERAAKEQIRDWLIEHTKMIEKIRKVQLEMVLDATEDFAGAP